MHAQLRVARLGAWLSCSYLSLIHPMHDLLPACADLLLLR